MRNESIIYMITLYLILVVMIMNEFKYDSFHYCNQKFYGIGKDDVLEIQ
jgi:hypothetical protein